MALFTSYAPPGVYTTEIFVPNTASAVGTARIPVIIGEGQQFFTISNLELFRGSSPVQDDQAVNENISDQVTGFTQNFNTTFYPVVDGTGKGITTNNPALIQVQAIYSNGNVVPVTVVSLNGATGAFVTQDIIPQGTDLTISYYFKRGDTLVTNENETSQVPSYGKLWVNASGALANVNTGALLAISLTTPGAGGNLVSVQFVDPGAGLGVVDSQAVLGAGSDQITIITRGAGSPGAIRTVADLSTIINSTSIPTLDGGYLTAPTSASTQALAAGAAVLFSGGAGAASNTTFQVSNFPIVDGTNGGVTLTVPSPAISALVNGVAATIVAVNGAVGQFTLANSVAYGQTLTVTYYYNTWQNTYDLLPSANVASIVEVGLGPNRADYTQGVDYSLGVTYDAQGNVVANTVNWGNNVSEAVGQSAAQDSAPFAPSEVLTTLVDENVWLRPLAGATNGRNSVFTLSDTPTDGTGAGRPTDNPALIKVYVGTNPFEAFQNGAVQVAALNGTAQTVTLFNPPVGGTSVYASYYRNTLENQQYTVTVVNPGFVGLGTYTIQDNLGRYMPLVSFNTGASVVAQAGPFAATGVVYPFGFSDAVDDNGSPTETITLTFRNDGNSVTVPAVQASTLLTFTSSAQLRFTATNPGVAGNQVQVAVDVTTENPQPVVVNGNLVTIYAFWNGTLNSAAAIASYFPSAATSDGGQILAAVVTAGAPSVTPATNLSGGINQIDMPVSLSYTVSSSLATGGSGSVTAGGANIGYLDQTYEDPTTGFRVTIVNPADHVAYGVLTIPQNYNFTPGDTLVFQVVSNGARFVGTAGIPPAQANNQVAIFGLTTKVTTTLGATTGDTLIISTVRASGDEPAVGTFYYVTFTTNKQASDYALQLFTKPSDAYAQYGQPSTINRVSLGVQLMAQNGVQTFGVIQVPVVPGTNYASSASYLAALPQLKQNLPGLNRKADVVVPLSNDPTVHQALSQQLTTLATARYKGEGIGFVGYSQFTTYQQAIANATSLDNQRMIAIGNAAAGVLITNPTTGVALEYLVDGPFMAAAMAGLNCNPANDVATTLTLQNLTGFSRLLITYDDPTMDLMAANGLTLLLNNNGALLIRHYKTTDPANTLVSEPTSTTIADFVAQTFRANLQQFIGRKLVDSLVTDITVVCNSLLKGLVDGQIISGYQQLVVEQDPQDPTQVDVTVTFQPIFSLLYLSVTFTVTTTS
jgi:hypothetical protein